MVMTWISPEIDVILFLLVFEFVNTNWFFLRVKKDTKFLKLLNTYNKINLKLNKDEKKIKEFEKEADRIFLEEMSIDEANSKIDEKAKKNYEILQKDFGKFTDISKKFLQVLLKKSYLHLGIWVFGLTLIGFNYFGTNQKFSLIFFDVGWSTFYVFFSIIISSIYLVILEKYYKIKLF